MLFLRLIEACGGHRLPYVLKSVPHWCYGKVAGDGGDCGRKNEKSGKVFLVVMALILIIVQSFLNWSDDEVLNRNVCMSNFFIRFFSSCAARVLHGVIPHGPHAPSHCAGGESTHGGASGGDWGGGELDLRLRLFCTDSIPFRHPKERHKHVPWLVTRL